MKTVLLIAAALTLTGCDKIEELSKPTVSIWTDPTTGCRYYAYEEGLGNGKIGSLSIRYLKTGLPDCPGTRQSLQEPL
jgi:hypothetical protein